MGLPSARDREPPAAGKPYGRPACTARMRAHGCGHGVGRSLSARDGQAGRQARAGDPDGGGDNESPDERRARYRSTAGGHRSAEGGAEDARSLSKLFFEQLAILDMIGLIKAIDRFELSRGVEFTSFAIPYIVGEIKRFFRDTSWAVHVPTVRLRHRCRTQGRHERGGSAQAHHP